MKENDNEFIKSVVDFYYTTVDGNHPQGNMSAVAEKYKITRAKVNKILITAGVIDSPLHQDIMRLKNDGYSTYDIASSLGVSEATVKINMPYEKVIYNGEEKSIGAKYVEAFRAREKIFLSNVVRKKGDDDMINMEMNGGEMEMDEKLNVVKGGSKNTAESKLFGSGSDIMLLNIELDADLSAVKEKAGIKHGISISRDILVPASIPLHSMHYVINEAFGFTNSHLHEFTLFGEDLYWITQDKVERWKKMAGLIFKNVYRDGEDDFWDDNYDGGSPKNWMRSKYTGPYYRFSPKESYRYVQKVLKKEKFKEETIDELTKNYGFDYNPFSLSENVAIGDILSPDGHTRYKSIEEYDEEMRKNIEKVSIFPDNSYLSQPHVSPFADMLYYTYDYGDDWNFIITPHDDIDYLEGRVSREELEEAVKKVHRLKRPVAIAQDGLPLIDDVGGVYGFADFLNCEGLYEDKEERNEWAQDSGWTGKMKSIKSLL